MKQTNLLHCCTEMRLHLLMKTKIIDVILLLLVSFTSNVCNFILYSFYYVLITEYILNCINIQYRSFEFIQLINYKYYTTYINYKYYIFRLKNIYVLFNLI